MTSAPHVRRRELAALLRRRATEHVPRPHAGAHANRHPHTRRERGADRRARTQGYGIHLPAVCLRHNKQGEGGSWGGLRGCGLPVQNTKRAERRGRGGEGGRLSGALREGVPNWQPEVQITRTAVTATRQALHTSRVDDNHRSSPI